MSLPTTRPSAPGAAPAPTAESTSPGAAAESSAISKYRLLAELGRGGMADVFLAMTMGPGGFSKLLVLKQLRVGDDPNLVAMFLDEARLAARVSHPNIVQTFEVVHEASRAFMVMEFLDGPSLSRLRRAAQKLGQRVPLKVELKILSDALLGLHYAHELRGYDGQSLGVVHRDFTPQNLIVTYEGDVKIVDFGIAKALDQQTQTSVGMFKGKLTYVPPEQLMAQTIDRRADLFSAGVMLFEAVTGQSPWKDLNNAAVTHALAGGQVPKLMELATAPPELAALCDHAMAVDKDDRPATADELRSALDDFIRGHGLEMNRAELGAYVNSVFGDAREKTRRVIEEQLKQQISLPTAQTLTQSLPTLDGVTPSPPAKVIGRSLPLLMTSHAMPDTNRSTSAAAPAPVAPSRVGPVLAVLSLVVLALASLVVFLVTRPASQPLASTVATPAPAAVPIATPPPVAEPTVEVTPVAPSPHNTEKVAVRLRATPSTARLFLDDLELPGNPFAGEYPQDGAVHELRVSAPGYVDLRRGVQFERDVTIDVSLSRIPNVVVRPAPAAKPVAEPKPAQPEAKPDDSEYFPPASGVKKQPKRPLDSNIEFH